MYRSFSLSDFVSRVEMVQNAPASRNRDNSLWALHPDVPQDHSAVVELVTSLKVSGVNTVRVCAALRRMLSLDVWDVERLRFYFSRVPIPFTYERGFGRDPTSHLTVTRLVLAREGQEYRIGGKECPREYFERLQTSEKRAFMGSRVWGLYPPDEAERLSFPLVPTWPVEDSIVDWLVAFVQTEAICPSPRFECVSEGDDIIYRFTYPAIADIEAEPVENEVKKLKVPPPDVPDIPEVSEVVPPPVSEAVDTSEVEPIDTTADIPEVPPAADETPVVESEVSQEPVIDAEVVSEPEPPMEVLSPAEQIYRFIKGNGDTTTDEVLAQAFASERQTKRLLSQLVNAGRFERVKHGVYRAVVEVETDIDGETD